MIWYTLWRKLCAFIWPPSIFDKAPFLSRWYFTATNPDLSTTGRPLHWKFVEYESGQYLAEWRLFDKAGTCLGQIGTFQYLYCVPGTTLFLCWGRGPKTITAGPPCLEMHLFDTRLLHPMEPEKGQTGFAFGEPLEIISIPLDAAKGLEQAFTFPECLKKTHPFLIVSDVPGIYQDGRTRQETTILELIPAENRIQLYPQDWFNKGNADFGYVWITRAVRHPETGHIYGQGIRMNNFILNPDGRTTVKFL